MVGCGVLAAISFPEVRSSIRIFNVTVAALLRATHTDTDWSVTRRRTGPARINGRFCSRFASLSITSPHFYLRLRLAVSRRKWVRPDTRQHPKETAPLQFVMCALSVGRTTAAGKFLQLQK